MINNDTLTMHRRSFRLEHLPDGSRHVGFCDPFTGDVLSPESAPPSIEGQPKLARGLDYLRSKSDSLQIDIMAAPHGHGDVHDMAEMIREFSDHDAIFFEGLANTRQQRDLIWDVSAGNKSSLTDNEVCQFGEYGVRKLAALSGMNKPVFFSDIPSDGDTYERALLNWGDILETLMDKMNAATGEELENLQLTAGVNVAAATIMREWYMIASIGAQLADLEIHGSYESTNPLLLVGSLHGQTLPSKLSTIGVKSSLIMATMTERGEGQSLTIPFDMVKALSHCAVKF